MAAQIFQEKCNGCGYCVHVCPHQIIVLDKNKKAKLLNERDCIECGACTLQCPSNAILTHPLGCGCAAGVLKKKMRKLFRQESVASC